MEFEIGREQRFDLRAIQVFQNFFGFVFVGIPENRPGAVTTQLECGKQGAARCLLRILRGRHVRDAERAEADGRRQIEGAQARVGGMSRWPRFDPADRLRSRSIRERTTQKRGEDVGGLFLENMVRDAVIG